MWCLGAPSAGLQTQSQKKEPAHDKYLRDSLKCIMNSELTWVQEYLTGWSVQSSWCPVSGKQIMVNTQQTCTADRNAGVGGCSTHRPADEEHRDGSDQRYVSDQRLQDHAQLPVQLRKRTLEWRRNSATGESRYLLSYLDSFHPCFAEVLFDFYIYFHIPCVSASRRAADCW